MPSLVILVRLHEDFNIAMVAPIPITINPTETTFNPTSQKIKAPTPKNSNEQTNAQPVDRRLPIDVPYS